MFQKKNWGRFPIIILYLKSILKPGVRHVEDYGHGILVNPQGVVILGENLDPTCIRYVINSLSVIDMLREREINYDY